MLERLKLWFGSQPYETALADQLGKLRHRAPIPVFWLFGKTQSGKTSVVRFLTGAADAEIGEGFRPCTRFSREYRFPAAEAPLLTFLDTRGVDEPGYDVSEDLARFNDQTHVVIVTVKALDHAQENVLKHLRAIRAAQPARPVILTLTCLHEAYPQQQHPEKYPYEAGIAVSAECAGAVPESLQRSLAEQCRRFEGLADRAVPVDLTRPEEGFQQPDFGGEELKQALLDVLPRAYRQTLLTLAEANQSLHDLASRRVLPHIIGYSTLAATAGVFPIPWVDLMVLPGIQTQMIFHLARLHGQELSGSRFLELASTLGMGMLMRQAAREAFKLIPFVGSVAAGAVAGASTFALGKAFCYYYRSVHQGHVPQAEELKRYYDEQLNLAERAWKLSGAGTGAPTTGSS